MFNGNEMTDKLALLKIPFTTSYDHKKNEHPLKTTAKTYCIPLCSLTHYCKNTLILLLQISYEQEHEIILKNNNFV